MIRKWILLIALGAMVGVATYAGYSSVIASAQPRPDSYRAAVERRLDQVAFSYRDVEVVDSCAPSYQLCRTYAGQVRVLTEVTTLNGQIDCRRRWTSCTLTIPGAGLSTVALPDVVDSLPLTIEEVVVQLKDWFYLLHSARSSERPQIAHIKGSF